MSASPKRIKLELSPSPRLTDDPATSNDEQFDHDHCVICLQSLVDRTVIPTCSHEFCFECISLWAEQSQKCPLCSRLIGEYLIHHIRSQFDYQKHYLPPPRSKSPQLLPTGETRVSAARRARRDRYWGRMDRDVHEADQLERAIAKRRWVYQNHLYAKHVASNSFTRYRPYPSPAQFAASPDMISRATIFLRRELRVWPNLDVEFLTTFTISLMKSIDIRAESSVKLLAEFLDLDAPYIEGQRHLNAEHFAHEIYSYIRSGRDLSTYDNLVQYDTSPDLPPPHEPERRNQWRYGSRDRSQSPHHRRPRSRSRSRSPPSRPPSSALHAEDRRSPSTVRRRDDSSDNVSLNRIQRRRTRSLVSERRNIYGTSNNQQRQPGDVQQQSVNKSERARGKERERYHTPRLRNEDEHHSSSAPPRTSGQLNDVVTPQQIAEIHISRDVTPPLSTPIHSCTKHTIVPPASIRKDVVEPEPTAPASRKRPGMHGRPPRTLLESVQAHLSRNPSSRPTKDAGETPQHLFRPSRSHKDARDGDNNIPALLSRLASPPTNALPASPSSHSLLPSSRTSTPLVGESISVKEDRTRRNLLADPIAKSTDEDMIFEKTMAWSYTPTDGEDKDNSRSKDGQYICATSPPLITDPDEPASCQKQKQKANSNSNPISPPHNSNPDHHVKVAEHIRRGNQEAVTYMNKMAAPSTLSRSSSDMRTVLLQRLEEEQRAAQRDVSTLQTDSTSRMSVVVTPSTSRRHEEAETLETRLRSRALLRIRLAAIKTAANQSMIES